MPMNDSPNDSPALTPALRWMADLMRLPELCAGAKCRRAHFCRGEPRECLARYAPLVPEEARDGVAAMLDGIRAGVDFDTLRDDAPEIDDLIDWMKRVDGAAARAREQTG